MKRHCCNWPGCRVYVRSKEWACRYHWLELPGIFRQEIERANHPDRAQIEDSAKRWAIDYETARALHRTGSLQ